MLRRIGIEPKSINPEIFLSKDEELKERGNTKIIKAR